MKRRLSSAGRAICVLAILALCADAATAQQGRRLREGGAREGRAREGGAREGGAREGRARDDGAPAVGDTAPLFKLKTLDGDQEVELAEVIKSKPVVLFFGSYT